MTLTRSDLLSYFQSGVKHPEQFRVGTEYEKLLLNRKTGLALPYEGDGGILSVLLALAEKRDWIPLAEKGFVVALQKGNATISLEPGGQFELSGAPFRSLSETADELEEHVADLRWLESRFDELEVLWAGIHPTARMEETQWMPKGRYRIMRNYLPTRGRLGTTMMSRTCTVQANLDYSSEVDAENKVFVSAVLGPIVTAGFANSRQFEGRDSGFASYRQHVWSDVDPDRCGNPSCLFPSAGSGLFERYMEWALDVPLFFVYRDGTYGSPPGLTFREWMEREIDGVSPTMDDWVLHLSTLFPNVRLKNYIEVRSADCVPPELILALPALWKGILYDAENLGRYGQWEAWKDSDTLSEAYEVSCREGRSGLWDGVSFADYLDDLIDHALAGLERLGENECAMNAARKAFDGLRKSP